MHYKGLVIHFFLSTCFYHTTFKDAKKVKFSDKSIIAIFSTGTCNESTEGMSEDERHR
jgi:hypothetical protein